MSELVLDYIRSKVASGKLRHISSAKGGEWCSPCPVCGGDDRFRCWPSQDGGAACQKAGVPGTWWCRKCDKGGDAIDLLMFAEGLEFTAACKELRIELSESSRRLRPLRQPKQEDQWTPRTWDIPTEKWRNQATKLVTEAHARLLESPKALDFLTARGLPKAAVEQYRLGILEGEDRTGTCMYRPRSAFDLPDKPNKDGTKTRKTLWIPRGFTIPLWGRTPKAEDIGEVHRVRIRRRSGDLRPGDVKFILLEGSGQAPMVLPPRDTAPALAVWVIVEAELDAMAVHFACDGRVGVMASLTNLGKPDAAAHKLMQASPLILVALDFDPPDEKGKRPGAQGWAWWQKHYPQSRRWPVPVGKDPGEAYALGLNLAEWVEAALPERAPELSPVPEVRKNGSLGATSFGMDHQGGGTAPQSTPSVAVEKEVPLQSLRHWQGATADTPLADAVLPEGCPTVPRLKEYYSGKKLDDELLIPCPNLRNPWWWGYYMRMCPNCLGHRDCVIDFITSPQMLAPEESHA